jgi:hypothetical protein
MVPDSTCETVPTDTSRVARDILDAHTAAAILRSGMPIVTPSSVCHDQRRFARGPTFASSGND